MRAGRCQRALCSRSRAADGGCEETAGPGGQEAAGESWARSCCHGRVTRMGHSEGTPPRGIGAPWGVCSIGPRCGVPVPVAPFGKTTPMASGAFRRRLEPTPVTSEHLVPIPVISGCLQVLTPTSSRDREETLPAVHGIPVRPSVRCRGAACARSASAICWQCGRSHQVRAQLCAMHASPTPPQHTGHVGSALHVYLHAVTHGGRCCPTQLLFSMVWGREVAQGELGTLAPQYQSIMAPQHPRTPTPQHPSARYRGTPTPQRPGTLEPQHPDSLTLWYSDKPVSQQPSIPTSQHPNTQHLNTPTLQYPNVPIPQHSSTPVSQHPSIPISQRPSTPVSQHPNNPASQFSSTPTPQHSSIPTTQHPNTPVSQPLAPRYPTPWVFCHPHALAPHHPSTQRPPRQSSH